MEQPHSNLQNMIQAELELRHRRRTGKQLKAPAHWKDWCVTLFPNYFSAPFAYRHEELWGWISSLTLDNYVQAFLAFWGRGGAKSTNAEAGTVWLGAEERRRYALYVSSTQDKADTHVANIAGMIESKKFGEYYHKMSMRARGKFGNVKGWRREHLQAANGFSVDAFGLDSGLRGIKIDEVRPDVIILDDIDEKFESPKVTLKKMQTITDTVLPSGSKNCAVLFIQNMISADSIASRLLDMRADFLRDRIVSGPFPAIDDFAYELRDHLFVITDGTPTWAGQDLATCQSQINLWGISAFRREAQHEVDLTGGIWDGVEWWKIKYEELPKLKRIVCWIDPAITDKPESASQGISIGGLDYEDNLIGLYWWEGIDSPEKVLERGIYKAHQWGCEQIGVETNQGGDTWKSVYKLAAAEVIKKLEKEWREANPGRPNVPPVSLPKFTDAKAGAGDGPKIERNGQLLTEYERGKVKHMLGTHEVIQKALRRFPNPPLDVADSWWWVWQDLIGKAKKKAGAWGQGLFG
jgi:hypothetical protein